MDRLLSQIEGYLKCVICLQLFVIPFLSFKRFHVALHCAVSVFRRRVKTHVPMLQVWTAEKPHPQEEVRVLQSRLMSAGIWSV